jgi:hypothetical protein
MYTDIPTLKKFESQINKEFGAEVVKYKPARNAFNLPSLTGKVEGGVEGFSVIMRKVFGDKVTVEKITGEIATRISGKYDSFAVAVSKTEGFYFRSIIGDRGSLTDKDLTPTKLNLGGKTLTKQNFDEIIEAGLINNSELPLEVLTLGHELLYLSKNSGLSIKTTSEIKKLMGSISSTDLKKFGKNFGEVLIANWCLYNKPNAISIFFPEEENNPLADFIVNFSSTSKKPPLNVSAKFEGGANASLNSIIQSNSKSPAGATDTEKKAFDAIMAVAYDKILDGLLNAEHILDTPEYKAIKQMGGGVTVTLGSISKTVEKAMIASGITKGMKWESGNAITNNKYQAFLNEMEPFYKLIPGKSGGRPDINTIPKILALGSGKYYHPVLYAFSVALADRFNTNVEFSNVLDKAATSIKAEQLYLDISTNNISIKVKEFSKSKFQFAAGAFAYKADNVRMKVKMLK